MKRKNKNTQHNSHLPHRKGSDPLVWMLIILGVLIALIAISNSLGFDTLKFG